VAEFFFFFLAMGWFGHLKPVKGATHLVKWGQEGGSFSFFNFFLIFLYYNTYQPSGVDTWRALSFWTENLTEVLIRSFSKIEVSSMMWIETQVLKNKVFKTEGPKVYLTLKIIKKLWPTNLMGSNESLQNICKSHPIRGLVTQYNWGTMR
jgi:hypothetical protein